MVEEYIAEQNATTNHVAKKPSNTVPEKLTLFKFESSACAVSTRPGQQNKQVSYLWNVQQQSLGIADNCRFARNQDISLRIRCRLNTHLIATLQQSLLGSRNDLPTIAVEYHRSLSTVGTFLQ